MAQCPRCKATIEPPLPARAAVSLAPTGGDYDWVESGVDTHCPACKEPLAARVMTDLTGAGVALVSLAIRDHPEWKVYALAWSRTGQRLLANTSGGARIFACREGTWEQTALLPGGVARRWDVHDEELVGSKWEAHDTVLRCERPSGEVTATHSLGTDAGILECAYDARRKLLVYLRGSRGGGPVLALGAVRTDRGTATEVRLRDLSPYDEHAAACFDLANDRVLVTRYMGLGRTDGDDMVSLWALDPEEPRWRLRTQRGAAPYGFCSPMREASGQWLVVSWLNERGWSSYPLMPYALLHLDAESLAYVGEHLHAPPAVCGPNHELRRAMLRDGTLYWWERCPLPTTNAVHALSVPDLAVELSASINVESQHPVDIDVSFDKQWLAVGFNNNLLFAPTQPGSCQWVRKV